MTVADIVPAAATVDGRDAGAVRADRRPERQLRLRRACRGRGARGADQRRRRAWRQLARSSNTGSVTTTTPDPDPTDNTDTIVTGTDAARRSARDQERRAGDDYRRRAGRVHDHGLQRRPVGGARGQAAGHDPGRAGRSSRPQRRTARARSRVRRSTARIERPGARRVGDGDRHRPLRRAAPAARGRTRPPSARRRPTPTRPTTPTTRSVTIDGSADVSIDKVAGAASARAGEELTYTLTARNDGPSTAVAAVLTDPLPAGFVPVSVTPTPACSIAGGELRCELGDMAPKSQRTITLSGRIDPTFSGPLANTATIALRHGRSRSDRQQRRCVGRRHPRGEPDRQQAGGAEPARAR